MKKLLIASLVLSSLSPLALRAQFDLDDEIDAELSRVYGSQSAKASEGTNNDAKETGNSQLSNSSNGGPSIQINVQGPQTQVSSTPSVESSIESLAQAETAQEEISTIGDNNGLDNLKKTRKQLEAENEFKVVEKLESSRIEDERTRTERLFGTAKAKSEESLVREREDEVLQRITNRGADDEIEAELIREDVRQEIRQSLELQNESEESYSPVGKTYFSALVGLGDYPDVRNVRGTYSVGFALGKRVRDNVVVDGSFTFSEFDVEQRDGGYIYDYSYGAYVQYPRITRMNQYQGSASVKYQPILGAIRPYVGGALAYTYRTFTDVQFALPGNDAQSHAIDAGFLTGVDLEVGQDFTIGFDFRYFNNITSRASNSSLQRSFARSVYNSDKAIETIGYSQLGITAKFDF